MRKIQSTVAKNYEYLKVSSCEWDMFKLEHEVIKIKSIDDITQ